MSTFNNLNVSAGNSVSSRINSIVSDTIGGFYPLVSTTNPITPSTLAADSESILSNLGIPANDRTLSAASVIANNIANGTLRDTNVADFNSYDGNLSIGTNDSPYGDIAIAFNELYDSAAEDILGPENTSVYTSGLETSTPTNTAEALAKQGTKKDNISTLTSPNYYAHDLIPYQPKIKYTYIVQITMNGEYQSDVPNTCAFLIKKFDKPKTTIEYEEVNFYNFFGQVPKRSKFEPVTFELHNDIKNEAMNFIVSYLRRVCPIFSHEASFNMEDQGMDFTNAASSYGLYTNTDSINIIQSIKIYDIFNGNRTMDVYTINNPKITTVDMGEWNMEEVSLASIAVTVVYDNWFVNTGVTPEIPQNVLGISELAAGNPQVLTSAGAAWDKKYLDLSRTSETNPYDTDVADSFDPPYPDDFEDSQYGDDKLSTDQLNTVASKPFWFQDDIKNINTLKNEPVTLPLAEELQKPLATNPAIPGTSDADIAKSLTPKFELGNV